MKKWLSDQWTLVSWCGTCIFLVSVAFFSPGNFQTGDTHLHYLIARYAHEHPELFLDLWGKPVFTLLYATVAPLGYVEAKLLTVFFAAVVLWQTARLAELLQLKSSFLVPVIIGFAPLFVWMTASCMTEVLFAAWLVSGIRLLMQSRWYAAAFFLSFLPFVRSEGFILLPFIALYPWRKKKYVSIVLFSSGTLLLSLVGMCVGKSILWVFTENPYPLFVDYYGKGDVLRFLSTAKSTWGLPFFLLWLIGLLAFSLTSKRQSLSSAWWLLIVIPHLVFLSFHSIAWATGTFASVGELRVLVCTMPLAAILAIRPLSFFSDKWKSLPSVAIAVVCIYTMWVIVKPPIQPRREELVMKEVAQYLTTHYSEAKIWCVDTQLAVELERDPWNKSEYSRWFPDPYEWSRSFEGGDVVVWDAHFAPNEGRTTEEVFAKDASFELVKSFEPKEPFLVLGNRPYVVHVFIKK